MSKAEHTMQAIRRTLDMLKMHPELYLDLLVELRDEVDARLEELATTDQG